MPFPIPSFLIKAAVWLAARWPWFGRKLNRFAINAAVNQCRHRPHPWSTVHSYVSWRSLTDRTYSARHLPETDLPSDRLPDISTILELFRRQQFRPCPKSTCLFPAFAQYLTDGFIRTRMPHSSEPDEARLRLQNTSNHEIDLCPLYGRNVEQTRALRAVPQKQRKGRLRSVIHDNGEEFADFLYDASGTVKPEFAVLDPPLIATKSLRNPGVYRHIFAFGGDRCNATPMVAAMNTLFLREHNRLADLLTQQNPDWDDDRVFETARNITIVLFIKIVVEEYINHISPSFRFIADPSVAWNAPWNKPNWITSEFSLLYRWHPLIPDQIRFGPTTWQSKELISNNTPLLECGLQQTFLDLSSQTAGQIGPFNTATSLLDLESRAIQQGRLCKLAPYADYKAYASQNRPQSFSDISKNPNVTELLKKCYRTVDDVEFYVGLFAEDHVDESPLPPLLRTMVAVDAFSQALTNPLLSRHVYNTDTFTKTGLQIIEQTTSLRDIVSRNSSAPIDSEGLIGMTRPL